MFYVNFGLNKLYDFDFDTIPNKFDTQDKLIRETKEKQVSWQYTVYGRICKCIHLHLSM